MSGRKALRGLPRPAGRFRLPRRAWHRMPGRRVPCPLPRLGRLRRGIFVRGLRCFTASSRSETHRFPRRLFNLTLAARCQPTGSSEGPGAALTAPGLVVPVLCFLRDGSAVLLNLLPSLVQKFDFGSEQVVQAALPPFKQIFPSPHGAVDRGGQILRSFPLAHRSHPICNAPERQWAFFQHQLGGPADQGLSLDLDWLLAVVCRVGLLYRPPIGG